MKHCIIYILLFLVLGAFSAKGQEKATDTKDVDYRFALGVQLGTDIGGAVPFPLKYVPETFNPYPKLNLSLGAKLSFPITTRWALGTEVTYKTVTLNADARVENQRYQDKEHIQYFSGTTEMHMDFTILEIPVYTKYTLRNGKDRLLLGPYFAWILKSSFEIDPQKGYIGTTGPDKVDSVMPDDMDNMDFDSSLDSWDMGILLGYERKLSTRFELGLRVSCGFKDIFKRDNQYFDYNMLHMRGSVVVSYNLFDIKPPKLPMFSKK